MLTKQKLKEKILEELQRYYRPSPEVHLNSKKGNFLIYYYNQNCPKGGEWHRIKGLPGKNDIKGSVDSARNYTSFILDYGQLMADLANKKAGEMKYKPMDFAYDSIMAIDTNSGDVFGPVNNPATQDDPSVGSMTKCAGEKKPKTNTSTTSDSTKVGRTKR
jgi:hypothetical protein